MTSNTTKEVGDTRRAKLKKGTEREESVKDERLTDGDRS